MDRNYPTSGFGDPLGAGQGWTYDRSPSGVKASLVYGGSRSSHPETDILHRQAYATPHPLQGYATNHHPAGLSGLFETGLHHAGSTTPDASVMNLISALESRAPQPGPSASSLLSQFRPPSWQTAMHTPGPAELFISGAIPGSGTFPSSSALSAYQHPASFSGRSFPVTSSLTLQDATFSPSSNGLLSPHDPLLHIKSSQSSVPSSLTFDRLGSAVLGTGLPSQSSAYRTAQESASRHLQSQFNLLSSPLGPSDQASQLYNTSVFSSSPASGIERAIPRQDSVIKHYQRPTGAQAQLPASHHSLQHYLSCGGSHSFQQMPRHSTLSCSPLGEQSPVSSEGGQKSSQARGEHSQSYRPIIQSPGYSSSSSSSSKSKSYSASRQAQRGGAAGAAVTPKCQSISSSGQSHIFSSSAPKASSVISTQAQAYSPGQSQALLGMNQSQSYTVSQAQNLAAAAVTQSPGFSSSQSQDLTAVSKAQSYSGSQQAQPQPQPQQQQQQQQPQALQTCVSQAQNYSPEQLQGLSSVGSIQTYSVQSEPHSSATPGQSYGPAHSQGMPAASPSLSYAAGHSPALSSHGPSIVYSSASHVQSLPDASPSPIIRPLQSPTSSRPQGVGSPGQSQKYLSSVLSPSFIQPPHSQAFQPSQAPLERAPAYGKAKADQELLASERTEDEDFLIQHLLDSQSPPRVSSQSLAECEERAPKGMVYEMSKSEERYHLQSVIRTSSSLDSQVLEMSLQGLKEKKKGERQKEYGRSSSDALVTSVVHYSHQPNSIDGLAQDIKKTVDHLQGAPHLDGSGKELSTGHSYLQKTPEPGSRAHHLGPDSSQLESHGILQGQAGSQLMLEASPEMQLPLGHQAPGQQSQLLQSVLTHTQSQQQAQQQMLEVHLQSQQLQAAHAHAAGLDSRLLPGEPRSPQLAPPDAMERLPRSESMQPQEMQEFLEPELHLESHLAQAGQVQQSQQQQPQPQPQHLLPEASEPLRLDSSETSQQVSQQQLEGKDQFSSGSPQSAKQRFVPLTSICFPDSLLQDEERNFFPGMEDMFCSAPCSNEEYSKQPCGDDAGQPMDRSDGGMKSGFDMMHSSQSFPGYCASEPAGGQQNVHLDLNPVAMKPELEPPTVQAEHLGLTPPGHGPTSADLKSPLTTASFCSMKTKKFLKTSSLHLLKKKDSPPQPPKKNYAQEYEFEDEEKEDVPADIRLNNRRLPDLLPDLISSCRTRTNLSPVSDIDFCSGNNLNEGKKKAKRTSKPKEKGPPRPRGRPRIRPLEPPQGVTQDGPKKRGRGRGRGKKIMENENEGFKMEKQAKPSKAKVQGSKTSELLPIEAPESVPAESVLENSQTQEKIKKKIKEVEEKQPEMKSGFMASFLDFLKSGKRQQLPATTSSPQKGRPSSVINQPSQASFGLTQSMLSGPLDASESDSLMSCASPCKRFDDDLKKNLETLPSFSSDEEDSVSKNQDLQKSISSAISALYDPMDRKENDMTDNMTVEDKEVSTSPSEASQPEQPAPPSPVLPKESIPEEEPSPAPESPPQPEEKEAPSPVKLANKQDTVAIYGETDEDDEESGGEGAIRKWDEFVIKIDDIKELKLAMQAGSEPPPIWRVQKASLQQFVPEVRDGQRHFSSSAQYIEYPDEVKTDYQRLYVKFLENVEKKDYVRICSKKPWHRPLHLAKKQDSVAISGETDEEDEESGGEGVFRERDEFVVKIDDIKALKLAMQAGREPPPIWRVQKALLQKFTPEIRDGHRQFCATSKYLGYFGHAKNEYQRLYVKFLENVNKKDYVRVCSKKPWHRPQQSLRRQSQTKTTPNRVPVVVKPEPPARPASKPKQRPSKAKAEPPPKKRKKWLKEVASSTESDSTPNQQSEEERIPTGRILNTRAMKEMYKSYIELLVSAALDPAMIETIEANNDELYLPTMRKIDGILTEHKKRVTKRVSLSSSLQEGLQAFPQLVVEDCDADRKDNPASSVKLKVAGTPYNRKTLNQLKKNVPRTQDFQVEAEKLQFYTLFHSLHHYKYHTLLHCKEQTDTLSEVNEDLGQEEIVQQCMRNVAWLEKLFDSFSELLTQVQQQCA
ncbi:proline-rich protein 12 isoform X1 [Rhincodon typus]|uniref:proline-rich protein 12 isoform X1 n=1 Tax=Rhincodon typus TaxID=259920 RepID=UPI002030F9B5|nr:proline-rich protein 12 isoform X1 [Rhincodon typus]